MVGGGLGSPLAGFYPNTEICFLMISPKLLEIKKAASAAQSCKLKNLQIWKFAYFNNLFHLQTFSNVTLCGFAICGPVKKKSDLHIVPRLLIFVLQKENDKAVMASLREKINRSKEKSPPS